MVSYHSNRKVTKMLGIIQKPLEGQMKHGYLDETFLYPSTLLCFSRFPDVQSSFGLEL